MISLASMPSHYQSVSWNQIIQFKKTVNEVLASSTKDPTNRKNMRDWRDVASRLNDSVKSSGSFKQWVKEFLCLQLLKKWALRLILPKILNQLDAKVNSINHQLLYSKGNLKDTLEDAVKTNNFEFIDVFSKSPELHTIDIKILENNMIKGLQRDNTQLFDAIVRTPRFNDIQNLDPIVNEGCRIAIHAQIPNSMSVINSINQHPKSAQLSTEYIRELLRTLARESISTVEEQLMYKKITDLFVYFISKPKYFDKIKNEKNLIEDIQGFALMNENNRVLLYSYGNPDSTLIWSACTAELNQYIVFQQLMSPACSGEIKKETVNQVKQIIDKESPLWDLLPKN